MGQKRGDQLRARVPAGPDHAHPNWAQFLHASSPFSPTNTHAESADSTSLIDGHHRPASDISRAKSRLAARAEPVAMKIVSSPATVPTTPSISE